MVVLPENTLIRKADPGEHTLLTTIAFQAKCHWKYPQEYYEIWKDELTITEAYIRQNIVYVAEISGTVAGFYSIVDNDEDFHSGEVFVPKGFWLEHLFIMPEYHNRGIGQSMMKHAVKIAREKGIESLLIFADPFAKGFYDKIGARYLHDSKSSIPGRMIPVYELKI